MVVAGQDNATICTMQRRPAQGQHPPAGLTTYDSLEQCHSQPVYGFTRTGLLLATSSDASQFKSTIRSRRHHQLVFDGTIFEAATPKGEETHLGRLGADLTPDGRIDQALQLKTLAPRPGRH